MPRRRNIPRPTVPAHIPPLPRRSPALHVLRSLDRTIPHDPDEPPLTPAEEAQRPRVRADCLPGGINAARPCPWAACKYSLILEVHAASGAIKLNADLDALEQLRATCVLDVADRGGITLEEVGETLQVTRERIRQVEAQALALIARSRAGSELALFAESESPPSVDQLPRARPPAR